MAAPPPEGFSRWSHHHPAAAAADSSSGRGQGGAPEARSPTRRSSLATTLGLTPWLWLPLALSCMLLVLFAVVVNRQQVQAQRLDALFNRVRTLEHSRALERTAVLEQQLRAMLTRLQDLEKQNQRQQQLATDLQSLQQEMQLLRATARSPLPEPSDRSSTSPESRRLGRPAGAEPITLPEAVRR